MKLPAVTMPPLAAVRVDVVPSPQLTVAVKSWAVALGFESVKEASDCCPVLLPSVATGGVIWVMVIGPVEAAAWALGAVAAGLADPALADRTSRFSRHSRYGRK